jgi:hypothetical protein
VYVELQTRQSLLPGLAPASICHPLPFNFLRIRTYNYVLPQPLYNPHFHRPLGSAGNTGLTGTEIYRQLFCNQHLRTPLGSAGNTGLIILLESALTKNAPTTPLESALTKMRGEGGRPSTEGRSLFTDSESHGSHSQTMIGGSSMQRGGSCRKIGEGYPDGEGHHYDSTRSGNGARLRFCGTRRKTEDAGARESLAACARRRQIPTAPASPRRGRTQGQGSGTHTGNAGFLAERRVVALRPRCRLSHRTWIAGHGTQITQSPRRFVRGPKKRPSRQRN